MKNKRRKLPLLFKLIIPLLPLVLAYIAYYQIYAQSGSEYLLRAPLDALYSAIRVYGISLDKPGAIPLAHYSNTIRVLLEIARWGAMVVMAAAVLKLLQSFVNTLHTSLIAANKHSIALYGDAVSVAQMKKELGARAIADDNPARFRAANHVLAFRETDDLYRYINAHHDELMSRKSARYFLYSADPLHPAVINPRISIHNMAEACARIYWRKNWLRPDESRVVIIGSNRYAEDLLTYALQTNVFLSHCDIEYHVFGDWKQYLGQHPGLTQAAAIDRAESGRDSVYLHKDAWYEQLQLVKHASRVIICMDNDAQNTGLLDLLLENRVQGHIYVKICNTLVLKLFGQDAESGESSITAFGTDEELFAIDQATNATTLSKGRLMNASYYRSGCPKKTAECKGDDNIINCLKCPQYIEQWNHSSAYNRSSSIAQGDHIPIKIRELLNTQQDDVLCLGTDAYNAFKALDDDMKKRYLELEHNRWMRYMYLHGWRYAPARNNAEMEHNLLIPFDQLPEKEQMKDCQPYDTLSYVASYDKFKKEMLRHI